MIVFTTLFIGKSTIVFNPFVIVMERPYIALATFLINLGILVFIYLAIDKELLD